MTGLTRRRFLALSGGAAVAGAATWAGLTRERATSSSPHTGGTAASDRVLVVVQLTGGNDALNTVIPHDGRYHDLRPTLALADDQLLALDGEAGVGLHPALQPLVPLWQAGDLAIVPGVGFAADSRSHFESLATWWTASPEHTTTSGWLGRWLDATGVARDNPLAAISLGGGAVATLRAERAQSTAVNDIGSFRLLAPAGVDGAQLAQAFAATASPVAADPLDAQSQAAVTTALRAVDVLSQASAPPDAAPDSITAGLLTTASLVQMDLGTRVFVVSGTGFDTHANQLTTHNDLLADFAGGVSAFFDALAASGAADRVVLLTTSEFGRRAAQNGSDGTDHGHGGVHFVAGPAVHGGLHGTVDVGGLVDGDLAAAVDARTLYAAGLDWLGGPSDELLDGHRDTIGLVTV